MYIQHRRMTENQNNQPAIRNLNLVVKRELMTEIKKEQVKYLATFDGLTFL